MTLSYMISRHLTRQERSGIILIYVGRDILMFSRGLLRCLPATQYCDGLRGAFVIYDPQDPYKSLYDFDDGRTSLIHYSNTLGKI